MHTMELAAASTQVGACADLAEELNGQLYVDERGATGLPFTALLTGVTDSVTDFHTVADVGLYLICRRLIKPGVPQKIALFPLRHHAAKSRDECDAHWRDVHAPLALIHHAYMTHYTQLSVVSTLKGEPFDGFALCGFDSEADIRERFFTNKQSVGVIQNDIQNFADVSQSPRRLIATPMHRG